MNIGKSIKVAVAMKGIKKQDLANLMGVQPMQISRLINQETCSGSVLKSLADALDMSASEFIALGE